MLSLRRVALIIVARVALIIVAAFAVYGAFVFTATNLVYGAETSYPCAGVPADAPVKAYPERRIYLEAQSWWRDADTTREEHVHVSACFPLFQHLTGSTLRLDVFVQVHNNRRGADYGLRVDVYPYANFRFGDDGQPGKWTMLGPCMDCNRWVTGITVPLDDPAVPSGLQAFNIFAQANGAAVDATSRLQQRPYGVWPAYIDNGHAEQPPIALDARGIENTSWQQRPPEGGSAYARSFLADVPWDPATGLLVPKEGIWTPGVACQCTDLRATIDPHFHAMPPDPGRPVPVMGDHLMLDTTELADGEHRLVLLASWSASDGTRTGVGVFPFLVANGSEPPTTTTEPTTTMPTTTTPPPPSGAAPARVVPAGLTTWLRGDEASLAADDGDSYDVRARSSTTGGWIAYFAYYPSSAATLYLKAAAGRPCSGGVAVGGDSGWRTVAAIQLVPQWSELEIQVPRGTTSIRLLCTAPERPTISTEQAVLR